MGAINLALILITAPLIIWTYCSLVNTISEEKMQATKMKYELKNEIDSLNNRLAQQQGNLTPKIIEGHNKQHGTISLSQANQENLISKFQKDKSDKENHLYEINQRGILSYIPPWPVLIFGALVIFITRLINNFGDYAPTLVCHIYIKLKRYF